MPGSRMSGNAPPVPVESFYAAVRGHYLAVKGVAHPPGRLVSVLAWRREPGRYVRAGRLDETYELLAAVLPEALRFDDVAGQVIPAVPLSKVEWVIAPAERRQVAPSDRLSERARQLMGLIDPDGELGVRLTGSMLLGLHDDYSDIDLVVFSASRVQDVAEALEGLRRKGSIVSGRDSVARDVVSKRADSAIPVEVWIELESRKRLVGEFRGTHFSVKAVPRPEEFWEPYGTRRWRALGRCVVVAEVTDARFGATTPNAYGIEAEEVLMGPERASEAVRVESMRSRFSEAASLGERVIASGRLEVDLLSEECRVFLGSDPRDAILPLELLRGRREELVRKVTAP
ncbi:MAG: nucleotidyltransferase domain-containing protein [Candidatus Caldarchaeales archaeon]